MRKKIKVMVIVAITIVITSTATRFYDVYTLKKESGNLLRAKNIIVNNYVEKLSNEQITKMEDAAINAMVESLNDPYSRYLNAEGYKDYEESNEEEYTGIGISVSFDFNENTMTVTAPYEGSPAQKAGVLPGDIITEVDGVKVTSETYNDIIEHIRSGEKGESVAFKIKRGDANLNISVERDTIIVETVTHKMLEDSIGYIRISQFIDHTTEDFEAALKDLEEREMKGLIIDLRSNPGGYAHAVLSITDMLLPKGTIAYLEDNQGRRQYFESDARCVNVPMAILINRGTASASELLAGSVKAYELGTVIGEKSFGKAVGQSPYTLIPSKTAIYLTNARYFTPKGECIDKLGIEPDIKVELSDELLARLPLLTLSEDSQLAAAIDNIKEKTAEK